jgi:hypothetical protein
MRVTATDFETCICSLASYKDVTECEAYLNGEADHVDAVLESPVLGLTNSLQDFDIVDGSGETVDVNILGHSLQHISYHHFMF